MRLSKAKIQGPKSQCDGLILLEGPRASMGVPRANFRVLKIEILHYHDYGIKEAVDELFQNTKAKI